VNKDRITLAHGNGGQLMQDLIHDLIVSRFNNTLLNKLDDSAVFDLGNRKKKIAFTTDSFVVNPIFFPGGDIGKLAVCGTVNDLSVMGAQPLFLSASLIIEEGFLIDDLRKIIGSMRETVKQANAQIVCGDTKVVNKGYCDKIFINTAGIGLVDRSACIGSAQARPGDAVIVSGSIGEHGISILTQREGLRFRTKIKSDCAPLHSLVKEMMAHKRDIHVMRDPTRGGVAAALNEIAGHSSVGIVIDEENVPVSGPVRGACEILGLDPLYLPCEGRLVAFVAKDRAKGLLNVMRRHPQGKKARIVGRVTAGNKKQVYMNTIAGSQRIVDMPIQEQMPRIC